MKNLAIVFTTVTWMTVAKNQGYAQSGPAGIENSSTNVLWLKADSGVEGATEGAPVFMWRDQSGNHIDVEQTTPARQPVYRSSLMNGMPAIAFDNDHSTGQNDFMTAPDNALLDNTSGYTIFTVTNMTNLDGSSARSILSKRTGIDGNQAFMLFYYSNNYLSVDIDGTNNRFNTSPIAYTNHTGVLSTVQYDGTLPAAQRSSVYNSGTFIKSAYEASAFVSDKASPLVLGATHIGDNRAFGGHMSEIIIYRTALNDASKAIINNYLSAKYNIPLSSNDKYAGDDPANGNYDREVAGIGREASGASTSFAASVAGGLGVLAHTGLETGDYILAGHASPSNSYTFSDVGGMSGPRNARWERIWYMDVTNTLAPVNTDLEFDAQYGGVTLTAENTAADYVLLYRSAQTGDWTEVTTATAIVGTKVVFQNIDITADGYYTIGNTNYPDAPLPVQLASFQLQTNPGETVLFWATVAEYNSRYFVLERSKDGVSFDSLFAVAAAGESSRILHYRSVDTQPLRTLAYYRLKIVDRDGSIQYSAILSAVPIGSDGKLSLYPNPMSQSEDALYLQLENSSFSVVEVTLRDMQGKVCYTSRLTSADLPLRIPAQQLAVAGMYILEANTGLQQYFQKLVVE
jgi:hypothetical protein